MIPNFQGRGLTAETAAGQTFTQSSQRWRYGDAMNYAYVIHLFQRTPLQRTGISRKLLKIYFIQILLISTVTVFGVLAAALITEEFLVNQALEGEADYFWQRHQKNPRASLPDSLNLQGYLSVSGDTRNLPGWLIGLPQGMSRVEVNSSKPIVHVSQRGADTLYLIFNEKQVSRLSFFFGIVPLTLVLLVLYGLAYFTYSQAKKAVSPIMHLARRVEQHELEPSRTTRLDLSDLRTTAEEETFVLVDAIDSFITRMDDFVERERNFTRYASHELRTPLSVIKGSVANLQQEQLSERSKRQVKRIDNTVTDMESLLDALLELARESHQSVHHEPLLFNDLAELVVEQLRETQPNPDVHLDVINNGFLSLSGSPKLIRILLTNLLKNALAYTDRGRVEVIIDAEGFSVKDTGMGIEEDKLARIFDPFYRIDHRREKGFGLGLAIVQKVCQELEWDISVSSQPGEGSCFRVNVAAT